MTSHNIWITINLQSNLLMVFRICVSIQYRRPHRSSVSKLINWLCTTRYILRSSPLSLRLIDRSRICNHSRVHPMIPIIHTINPKSQMIKSTIRSNIRWSKYNLLPPTLLRISRNAPTILRLPGCLHNMKYCIINRVHHFIHKSTNIYFHYLRKNKYKPTNSTPYTNKKLNWMNTKLTNSGAQLLRITYHHYTKISN
jgi:hypothetical protein